MVPLIVQCRAEGAVEAHFGNRLLEIGQVDIGDGRGGPVYQQERSVAADRTVLGKDVDRDRDRRDLGLWQALILLVEAFVFGLQTPLVLGGSEAIQHVGIVEIPCPAAGEEQEAQGDGRHQRPQVTAAGLPAAAPVQASTVAGEGQGNQPHDAAESQPIKDGPRHRWNEMPVTVHVGVSVGGDFAEQVEAILNAVAIEDGHQHHRPDDRGMSGELVGDHGLGEDRDQNE